MRNKINKIVSVLDVPFAVIFQYITLLNFALGITMLAFTNYESNNAGIIITDKDELYLVLNKFIVLILIMYIMCKCTIDNRYIKMIVEIITTVIMFFVIKYTCPMINSFYSELNFLILYWFIFGLHMYCNRIKINAVVERKQLNI